MNVRGRRAFTLLETIAALFLLLVAALYTAQMFKLSIRAAGTSRDESLALTLAEKRLRAIEEYCYGPDNFAGVQTLGTCDPIAVPAPSLPPAAAPFDTAPDADNPRFQVSARAWRDVLHTPGRGLQGEVPMTASALLVKVTVSWGDNAGAPRGRTVSVVGVVREPPRTPEHLTVEPSSTSTLAVGSSTRLTATATDAVGTLKDVMVRWYVVPQDGSGTLSRTSGNQATFWNCVTYPDDRTYATGGTCVVKARAMSDRKEASGVTTISLDRSSGAISPPADLPSRVVLP